MELYPYFIKLVAMFSFLGAWQRRALALWCSGVVRAGHCQIPAVADALVSSGCCKAASLERRLGRFLSNPRISDELLSRVWVGWLVQEYGSRHWTILVDETKLGPHLSVMMVSLAYQQRAIPLLWRCYRPQAYPAEGQVAMIMELVSRLRLLVPTTILLTLQADRGIGTSPALITQLEAGGWRYLLRVQNQVRLRLSNGRVHALKTLVKPGEVWYGRADAFKHAGWRRLYVCLDWRLGEAGPWCLVTNTLGSHSAHYRQRAWHEQSFRDLKSFGLQWHRSHVWTPRHAHRLLFVLALAYTWVLSQANLYSAPAPCSPARHHPRQSLFRRGWRWIRQTMFAPVPQLAPILCLVPKPP